jgi:threonine dehydrogenase-like Zn-dependent dehydrogenase
MYFKELTILNSRATKNEDFPAAIDLVASGTVKLEPLVSHTMPMSDLGVAMHLLASDTDQRLKIILGND